MLQITMPAVPGLPLIQPGDDLAALILAALDKAGLTLAAGDVLVVTSKIVSKAEGRFVNLEEVTPGPEARRVAASTGKEPALVEVILSQSARISRFRQGVLIVEHKLGFVSANAGVDHSNVQGPGGAAGDWVLLLPAAPDRSAAELRARFMAAAGAPLAVIISDSHGRPFRLGTVGVAIGAAGLPALYDLRGREDLFGRKLEATQVALADELAAAAGLVSGQAGEGLPVTLIRGLSYPPRQGGAAALIRPRELDLYR